MKQSLTVIQAKNIFPSIMKAMGINRLVAGQTTNNFIKEMQSGCTLKDCIEKLCKTPQALLYIPMISAFKEYLGVVLK
ncbi:hypothetical protein A1QO_06225 [Vibrio genomosp. F10 str. ZF-129]|uniref:Uncharacterized protein n=1 Tax=Vibrio genomosp. F10 str. ZF-129 TaxID=1187848 RepID=A0A1E5BGD2_9VIBR|nr:hypothetical protein [Vibrio genomosp. F10]OEE34978.1 hypothetical protein A1QO_06225 [Vibrio genomosp. F10 str. ZF-129]